MKHFCFCMALLAMHFMPLHAGCNCKVMYKWHCSFGKLELLTKSELTDNQYNALNSMLLLSEASTNTMDSNSSISQFNRFHKAVFNGYFEILMNTAYEYFIHTNGLYDPTLLPLEEYYASIDKKSWSTVDTAGLREQIKLDNFYSYTQWSNPVKTADGRDSSYMTIEAEDVKYRLNLSLLREAFLLYQFQIQLDSMQLSDYEIHSPYCHYVHMPHLAEKAGDYFMPFRKFSVDPMALLNGRKSMAYVEIPAPLNKKSNLFIPISKTDYKPAHAADRITYLEGENIIPVLIYGMAVESMRSVDDRQAYIRQFPNFIYFRR